MNLPEFPSGSGAAASSPPGKKELQLQGTRPPPLRVSKDSHTIHKTRKPPLPPTAHLAAPPPENRKPVIIYTVSPKVLHVPVNDFMNVVQRLTGPSSGDVSPAARLAAIERTSPSERERDHGGEEDVALMMEGVEVGQFPGILSPATLPPISPGFFTEAQTTSFWHDLSPFWSTNSFVASPSGLFSAAAISPLPSPDIFNLFD
ncbi:hypothetical protein VNO80_11510 [Phaseolus coccineus]|uniref:VQ domain-containing protein n=1 Tax=Phaseolus coccineus TaxID=3886 RepID=A0AAN9REH3_PHACN